MRSNIPTNLLAGRQVLRTDLTDSELNAESLKDELERVLPYHTRNLQQIRELQEYHKGYHPEILTRTKTTRTDVDNQIIVNHAFAITRDIVGYFLGKPIQYTHRRGAFRGQMERLMGALNAENKALVDYQIAEDCSICGVGYRGVFSDKDRRNGTHLKLLRLDPKVTFVVYPSDPTKPALYAVTSYESAPESGAPADSGAQSGNESYYKVYTPKRIYTYKEVALQGQDPMSGAKLESVGSPVDINFGGALPIVEYENNQWRLGDWEVATTIMDAIDAVTSDGVNDIQQAVNSVLVAMGMELTEDEFKNLSANGFLNVSDIPPGVKPVVEFISQAMDSAVGKEMRDYLEATLRGVVGVPDRKARPGGGGDTGDAVFMRDGWQDIDLVATAKESYFIESEREALEVMLYVLRTKEELGKSLEAADLEIHFNRNKTANLQSKAQVYQSLTTGDAPLDPADALDIASLTNNVHDVIMRAESYREKMRKERIENPDDTDSGSNPNGGESSNAGDKGSTA